MVSCEEATRLMSESRERTLSLSERVSLRMHTVMCAGCRNFDKQVGVLGAVARSYAKRKDPDAGK